MSTQRGEHERLLKAGQPRRLTGRRPLGKRAARWENVCKRCGTCCYERDYVNGRLVVRAVPCKFLDTQTKSCTVYEHRFRICPDCRKMTIFHALFSKYLPASCGYVEEYRLPKKRT